MGLLLKGARLLDPCIPLDETLDLIVDEGHIAKIGKNLKTEGIETVDLSSKIIAPGFFDMHVHLREPGYEYKETIESGTRAAVHGGFTAICTMANTNPVVDEGAAVESIYRRAEETAHCQIYTYGAITRRLAGKQLAEMGDMLAAGAVGFSDDGKGVQNSALMRMAMDYAKMFGVPLVLHCEDEALVGGACVNEGKASTRLGVAGSPSLGESLIVSRDIALAQLTGCAVHICHVSTKESIDAIRLAKAKGIPVTAEVTPHHLLLTDSALGDTYDTALKVNPPLRTEEDRQALIEALVDTTIDCIVSDHAPHAAHEKDCEFDLAAYGTTGLETTVALLLDQLVETGIVPLERVVDALTHRPRQVLNLEDISLREGARADLTVLDLSRQITITSKYLQGKSKNSAFLGRTLTGCATDVMLGGFWMMREGDVT